MRSKTMAVQFTITAEQAFAYRDSLRDDGSPSTRRALRPDECAAINFRVVVTSWGGGPECFFQERNVFGEVAWFPVGTTVPIIGDLGTDTNFLIMTAFQRLALPQSAGRLKEFPNGSTIIDLVEPGAWLTAGAER